MSARYAIYYAPAPESALHALATAWLGRDAWSDEATAQPPVANLFGLTSEPRRYGFHATLKAPFRLADGRSRENLVSFAAEFAGRHARATLPAMKVVTLGRFLALAPDFETETIQQLAAACVMEFDAFRAPAPADVIARRERIGLTRRQSRLLRNWDYPYVLDQFRFHMTLTNSLQEDAGLARLREAANRHFAAVINRPLILDAVAVFCQGQEGASFIAQERFPLAGRSETCWPELWKMSAR